MSLCVTIPYFGVDYRGNELIFSDLTLVGKNKLFRLVNAVTIRKKITA